MHQVEAFTAGGVMRGAMRALPVFGADEEANPPFDIERATWHPLSGGAAEQRGPTRIPADDVLVLWIDGQDVPIHAAWHDVELSIGPYAVTGSLPTLPGFDPSRALARPSGEFVMIRDARLTLGGNPETGLVERSHALVNRYGVERCVASIDLGYYFPGAEFVAPVGAERA